MFEKKHVLKNKQIAFFCHELGIIIKAGLPIHYGLSILRDETHDEKAKDFLAQIYLPMEKGATLYDSIKDLEYFPPYMVRMIRLGEETGRMEEVLDSLALYYHRESDYRLGLQHAIIYPLILILMMLIGMLLIITQVIPIFANVYETLDVPINGLAQTLLSVSNFMNTYFIAFLVMFATLAISGVLFYRTSFGKTLFQSKGVSMSLAASRFALCMHMVLSSGLDTDKGLEIALELVDNPFMEDRIRLCQNHLKHGEVFNNALLQSGIFSKVYQNLLAVGQQTGTMSDTMLYIGNSYEKETDIQLRRFITVLEPTLIVILSIFVGSILVTYLFPLLDILNHIS